MKRIRTLNLIALGLSIAWMALPAPARAQLPAPQPTFASTGTCPAQVRFDYDVSSVPNATQTQWQLRRGAPGSQISASTQIDGAIVALTSGSVERDLRQSGPVLDGTRWFFRVRARQGGAITDYSQPAIFEPDLAPDGMFSVSQPSGTQQLKLDWSLSGDLGACADRIAWEVKKDAPFANPHAPDASAARTGTVSGRSGSETIDLAALGAGTYFARLVARHGGNTVDDAVGRWGSALSITLADPLAREVNPDAPPAPPVTGPPPPGGPPGILPGIIIPPGRTTIAPTVALTGFQLQNGAATADVGVPVTLDAVYTGSPTEYKAGVCSTTFAGAPFQPFTPGVAPTLTFSSAGVKDVCFQLRTALATSAPANDSIEIIVTRVSVEAVAQTALEPDQVALTTFRLRNGAANVVVGTPITLNAVATGSPTHYRAALFSGSCEAAIASAPWSPWSAASPPTRSYTSAGIQRICIQLSIGAGSVRSAVLEDAINVVPPEHVSPVLGAAPLPGVPLPFPSMVACPAGEYAVGLTVSVHPMSVPIGILLAPKVITGMALRCAALAPGGQHGTVSTTDWVGDIPNENLACPDGKVLYGFKGRSGFVLDQVSVACVPWTLDGGADGPPQWIGPSGGTGGSAFSEQMCTWRLPIRYLTVTAGNEVINFRFGCEAPPEWGAL